MSSRRCSRAVTARTAANPPTVSPPRMTPWETRVPRAPASRPIARSSPRSSILAANCSPVVAAAKPSPDAAPMPTATAEALSPTPATACRSGATTPYFAARRLRLRMLMATTVPPVTTDGRRVVSRPGFRPEPAMQEGVPPRRGPARESGEGSDAAGGGDSGGGKGLLGLRPGDGCHREPCGDAGPGDDQVRPGARALARHGAGCLQGGPGGSGQLVVRGSDHSGGHGLLDGIAGEQAARERAGHGPRGAGDARLRRRVRRPPREPLGPPEERHGEDCVVGDVRPCADRCN